MSHEYDFEPVPGLPANLPEGEQLLWQGSPSASATARRVLHIDWVAAYFAALLTWRLVAGLYDGHTLSQIAIDSIPLLGMSAASIAILAGLASLMARTTIYSITSRRVVMRYGVIGGLLGAGCHDVVAFVTPAQRAFADPVLPGAVNHMGRRAPDEADVLVDDARHERLDAAAPPWQTACT